MEKLGLNVLREKFLSFFESKGHLRLESFPLVPQNDQSLLLINAGMAPLKPYFTGELEPPSRRATSCQKCIRTPDIDNVGKNARHGTYFEMLGNFSFGDYFKEDAIKWAWEFLTGVLAIPAEKLYCSVYLDDDEAYEIWTKQVGVSESHMVRLGKEDNFWEIGSGPCGPCSEIYFDRGEQHGCGSPTCAPGCDCDRYVEIWNLVFTQFNSDGQGNYTPLASKNIDTGMGLERLACVMQGTNSLFEVDTIARILERLSEMTGVEYKKDPKSDISLRIITDHIRSTVMLICDGVMPSNVGRGYVLRRLLRRAARHGRLLGMTEPFLYRLCETVIEENKSAYPQVEEKQVFIKTVIETEERRFGATIENGLGKLGDMIRQLRQQGKSMLPAADAFKLYDTDGFPIDLTVEILMEQGLGVLRDEFDALMRAQRDRAREARGNTDELGWESEELSLASLPETEFLGYHELSAEGRLCAIIKEGEFSGSADKDEKIIMVFDRTPMYAESGGQSADQGAVAGKNGRGRVLDVQKSRDNRVLHTVLVEEGSFTLEESLTLTVDEERRGAIMRAHSATHLLHKALRNVLGEHVEQAGSLVEPDRLRFDFTHFAAVTREELRQVEEQVNGAVLSGLPISVSEMPIDEAKKIGATALFGEKYHDLVRVVQMGDYSLELCGGTHLDNSAKVGAFVIAGEGSVASGIRRIEAMTGKESLEYFRQREDVLLTAAQIMKTTAGGLINRAKQIGIELKQALQSNDALQSKLASLEALKLLSGAREANGVSILAAKVEAASPEALRSLGDTLRERRPELAAVLCMVQGDKAQFLAICGKEAVARGVHAGNLVKAVAQIAGGGGGGKPDSAMAGGKDIAKVGDALNAVYDIVISQLK